VILLKNDRKKYYRLLDEGRTKNTKNFVNFIGQAVERSLDLYLSFIEEGSPEKALLPLSALAKKTKYSSEYLSLLARQGKIAAHKQGRIWYSSLVAIEDYMEGRLRKRD